jgi:hypothetical protein
MLDVVKTHAFAFKERLGYDVFKRCEELYFRKFGKFPSLNEDRSVMAEENEVYYREIIRWHLQLKREFEEQSKLLPQDNKGEALALDSESHHQQTRNQKKQESEKADLDLAKDGVLVSCDEKTLRKRARALKAQESAHTERSVLPEIVNPQPALAIPVAPPVASPEGLATIFIPLTHPTVEVSEVTADALVFQSPIEYDISKCSLAAAYEAAISLSEEMKAEGLFERLLEKALELTEDWSISDLITLLTSLLPPPPSSAHPYPRLKTIDSRIPTAGRLEQNDPRSETDIRSDRCLLLLLA